MLAKPATCGTPPRERRLTDTPPVIRRLRWPAVWLVCAECEDRKRAPKGLRGKRVVRELKRRAKLLETRPVVVSTRCLKLCPKGALVLACIGRSVEPRLALLRESDDVDAALQAFGPAPGANDATS